jgi:Flp pilus assembly protein TadG
MKHWCKLQNRVTRLSSCGLFRKKSVRHILSGWARDESGSLVLLGLMLTLLMAMMGGLAVDLMRYEERRASVQSTIDRSVLAAASLSQKRDSKLVVEDYFEKAGISEYLTGVTVDNGLNYRDVMATAQTNVKPFFTNMIGIDNLSASVTSRAEQRISNVEVSMVLDVSGSMGGSRINNLRPAAKEFIDSVLASSDPGRVSISIVPYNAQVNIGPAMMAQFNVAARHSSSYCIELPEDVFSTTTLSSTRSFVHNAHFDPWSGYYYSSSASQFNCSPNTNNQVLALSDNTTNLHNRIDRMEVGGNTSIDLGVKWGALLLDVGSQSVVTGMAAAGAVSATYIGRPLDPGIADVMKVLVVMTDGQNTTEYKINDPYNYGLSPIFRRNSNGALFAYFEGEGDGGSGEWVTTGKKKKKKKVWVPGVVKDYYSVSDDDWLEVPTGGLSGSTRLTWPQVWASYSVQYIAKEIYSDALDESYSTWYYRMIDYVSSTKDSRLQQACQAAKDAGIVVYGIGFEAPYDGREQVKACATSDAHYFDASGLEIATAFRAIASNISQLRLTQ